MGSPNSPYPRDPLSRAVSLRRAPSRATFSAPPRNASRSTWFTGGPAKTTQRSSLCSRSRTSFSSPSRRLRIICASPSTRESRVAPAATDARRSSPRSSLLLSDASSRSVLLRAIPCLTRTVALFSSRPSTSPSTSSRQHQVPPEPDREDGRL